MEQAHNGSTTKLRIGTWNVEHASAARNPRRLQLIHAADADIWVLTETQDGLDLGSSYNALHSEPRPKKPSPARWASIWARHPLIERVAVRDPIRTTAALYDTPLGKLLVYATVMPWPTDRGPSNTAPDWVEQRRVVHEQADDWKELRERHHGVSVCVAGDFNMRLTGRPVRDEGKKLLHAGLSAAGLACVTRSEDIPPGKLNTPHIDHICVPLEWAERASVVEAWPGTIDGVRLSDHSAIVVEVRGKPE
jgi:hypothetical protein